MAQIIINVQVVVNQNTDIGKFQSQQKFICNSSCLTCSSTIDTCSSCSEDRTLLNNQCICGEGYFDYQGNCQICHKSCQSCKDTEQFCLTCSTLNNRKLINNTCPCIDGYYESKLTFSCEKCDASCKTCSLNSYNCTSCDTVLNFDIINNKCLCKSGYYYDQITKQCSLCHISCKKCDQYKKCTQCAISTRQFDQLALTCDCKLGYFEINQLNCQKCHYQCETCSNDEKNCLSCHPLSYRQLSNNKCECDTGYFDAGIDICVPCGTRCKACIDQANKCTQCFESEQLRKLNINLCDCQSGYFDSGSEVCQKCSKKCKTCANSEDYCTSCDINQKRIDLSTFHQCPCISGFYEDQNNECQKCHIKCETCIEKRDKCLVCNDPKKNNRYLLSGQCNCKPGFFDDEIQLECQQCNIICKTCIQNSSNCLECVNNLRTNPPLCNCQDGYYEDKNTQNCMRCQNQCLTCIGFESNCTTCKPGRINKSCECEPGYIEVGQEDCLKCNFSCQECSLQSTNCTVCKGDRINPPICNCEDGYYDDESNEKCQGCDYRCLTCDQLGCLSCNGNRILSTELTCDPPLGSVSYLTTPWCSNCEVAVLDIKFSDDLSDLIIRFDFELKLLKSINICDSFLDDITLDLLGFGFNCKIDELDNRNLIIFLGIDPKILIGDYVIIKEDSLQHVNCDKKIKKFIFNIVKGPTNIQEPQIQFKVPYYSLSSCVENIIYQNFTACSGNRQFTFIFWSYQISEKENTEQVDDFINQLNINQEFNLVVPAKTLPESSTITFFILIQNFIGTQGHSSFTLNTQSNSQPIIKVDLKNEYFTYQEIQIPFSVQISNCQYQSIENSVFQIELSEILRSNQLSQSSNINYSVQSSDTSYSITIPMYTLTPRTIYHFLLKAQELNTQESSEQEFAIEIIPAKLLCQVENAVNVQNFRSDLIINILCKDMNTNINWNEDTQLQIEIICIDLQTNGVCLNQQKNKIEIIENYYQQKVPKYSVKPFTTHSWQVIATKGDLKNEYKQVIVFLDQENIPLKVNHSLAYINRNINNYELLDFKIQIPLNQQNNVVEISVGIIEDFTVIKLLQLSYFQFQLILQDYINFHQKKQNNQYNLKFAVQYSTSIYPSFYNLPIQVNIPPICTGFKQIENDSDGLTELEIIVDCAQADDSPYKYKFGYFLSDDQMQGYLNRSNGQILGLQVFQDSPKFKMIIPNTFKKNQIQFIVVVMDQGGSITNLFGKTSVGYSFDCQSKQTISWAQKSLSLLIAYMFQAIGEEGKQCQDLGKKIFAEFFSKSNLDNQELNFWLKALRIYKISSSISQTRLIEEIQNLTCYSKEKNIFQITSSNHIEDTQTKSYEELENDFLKFKQIVHILATQYNNLNKQLKDITQDWNQNLFQQYEEIIESLQLSMTLADNIFIDASLMNKNETKMFAFFQQLIIQIDYISQLISDRAEINGKPLKVEGKAFFWQLQRLTRKMLNENLGRQSLLEDQYVSFNQKEQFELTLNPYEFDQNISDSLQSQINQTKLILDSNKMIRLKLSNFNLQGKQIPQKEIETQFSIEMKKTGFCNQQEPQLSSGDFNGQCLQLSDDKKIQKCNISLVPQQLDDQISIYCICQTFGDTFIVYYQDQSQNISKVDILSKESIQNLSFHFKYESEFVIGLISYVTLVLIIFFLFVFQKGTQYEVRQLTQESDDFEKSKKQILLYPGNITIIKENIKYLHSLSSFCYQNSSSISNSFRFIDLNNLFCSMILIAYLVNFYIHIPIIIEIIIVTLVGIIYRAFSKILQGFVRINKCFEITVIIIEVIFFLIICFIISVLMSNSSIQNNIEQLKVIAIAAIIQFFIYEIILVTLSVFIYKLIYQSIKHKELNIIYHFVYFFVYHERLDIIFDQYCII